MAKRKQSKIPAVEQVQTLINTMVEEKVFSLEGLERIKELRDKVKSLENFVEQQADELDGLYGERNELDTKLNLAKEVIRKWERREGSLVERETKVEKEEETLYRSQTDADYAYKRGNEMKEILMAVVKNPVLNTAKSINRGIAFPPQNGTSYPTTTSVNDYETTTEEIK
jgi:chromosome segregation ATPase